MKCVYEFFSIRSSINYQLSTTNYSTIYHLKLEQMLQRIQSVWLLLAAGFNAITFKVPFYSGDYIHDNFLAVVDLNATTTIWLTILSVITALLAFISIFLFRNRKLQLRLTILGTFLTLGLLTAYILLLDDFIGGTISIWCVFYFAMLVCYVFAIRGIRHDEKLIKSMDRFR